MLKVGRGFDEEAFARVVAAAGGRLMLGLPPSVRIYFATEPRRHAQRHRRSARDRREVRCKRNPYEGHLFVFVGKAKDKVKILFWDERLRRST